MAGRCYGCASKFTLLRKELGCKNCGHAYCSSCLSYSTLVPRCGNTQQKVCRQCHGTLTRFQSCLYAVKGETLLGRHRRSGKQDNAAKWSPPENYKKRVAALEAKQQEQTAANKAGSHTPNMKYLGLSKEDRAIAERLEKLKEETKLKSIPSQQEIEMRLAALKKDPQRPILSTAEMEDRLALLKGQPPPSKAPRPSYQGPDTRTQTEQVNDLFKQMSEEAALDQKYGPGLEDGEMNDLNKGIDPRNFNNAADNNTKSFEEEKSNLLDQATAELKQDNLHKEQVSKISQRLATLKGEDTKAAVVDWKYAELDSDEENEELLSQRILKQVNEEIALDEASGYNIPLERPKPAQATPAGKKLQSTPTVPTAEATDSDEELPWCCICNSDAVIRCRDCDGDLYCQRCFREGHDKFERKEHRTSKYRPPNKKK
ncbi:abscission/NoCut checkpoint regulator isoform X3 [Chiloscyllium plagiosum]|uniref:abscission/NoCut checkpoint regulator isoform X3 n=1 Tax=Chiloscyllium plagiosum TaxID=36176 RepID=UPI001CB7B048|nr:abscission/NoCut checkpoint regulator isoform X3 [Chiloscyllium plagiosum]